MKYLWETKDVKAGMYVVRGDGNDSTDEKFTRTVTFKVGYLVKPKKCYCLVNSLTDGWVFPVGTKDELVEYLNKEEKGFYPVTVCQFFSK